MTAVALDDRLTIGRRFMARISGLPFDTVRGFRQPKSREWAEQIIEAQAWLAQDGARLSDELYPLVTSTEDVEFRRSAVNARRKIFQGSAPKDGAALAERIGGPLGTALRRWLDRHAATEELLALTVVEDELGGVREHLRSIVADLRYRQGLILASSSLDRYLDGYLDASPDRLSKRHRNIERSLVEYVYRSACKTSPFSTFTGIAVGEFSDGADGFDFTVDDQWTVHTQLNIAVLGRLGEQILSDHRLRQDLPVTLVNGWTADTQRIRYVRREVTTGDDTAAVSMDAVNEAMFFLRRSNGLVLLLKQFTESNELRYRDLLDRFTEVTGTPREQCDNYLATLLRLGLLSVPALAVDIHSPDPVRSFAESVRRIGTGWAGDLAEGLFELSDAVRRYRGSSLGEKRTCLTRLRELLDGVSDRLGFTGLSFPQTLLYEDSRATVNPIQVGEQDFRTAFADDLRAVTRMLPAFDIALPHKLTLRAFFLARYGHGGVCDDLLTFVSDFHEDIYDQYIRVTSGRGRFDDQGNLVPAENWLGQPEITAIDSARALFATRLHALAGESGPEASEIVLGEGFMAEVTSELGLTGAGFAPYSHFLQIAGGTPPRAVLNRSWGGLSYPFSRFSHGFRDMDLAGRLRADNRAMQPEGTVFAELTGGTERTNLNLHDRLTDYEIVCPGQQSFADPDVRIPLEDLSLRHDPESDRLFLWSRRLRREIVPIYLGYLVPMALPDVARTLFLLAPAAMVTLDVWEGVPSGSATGVSHRPRVRHGSLVLSRRSWHVPAEALPSLGPGATPGEIFLEWQRWRRLHRIDRQVFFTVQDDITEGDRPVRRHKPHYLDFDSYLSIQLFERAVMLAKEVRISEMFPSPDELHAGSSGGRHVAEIVMETVTTHPDLPNQAGGPGDDRS